MLTERSDPSPPHGSRFAKGLRPSPPAGSLRRVRGPRAESGPGLHRVAPDLGGHRRVASPSVPTLSASSTIDGVWIVDPEGHGDTRGRFSETYRRSWFPEGREMVQGNRSDKGAGAVVGIHYHLHQADYWQVVAGEARVVLHDLRMGSTTDGNTEVLLLSGSNCRGVWIPPGVGHGFASLTDLVLTYLVDQYYNPADELGVAWDDPEIGADWGVSDPILSERDRHNPRRADIDPTLQPRAGLRR